MAGDNASMLDNILQLTDDELLEKLQEHGLSGPIVDSTRSVYQKKLVQILEGGYVALPDCGDSEEENDRSDPEESFRQRILQPKHSANTSFQRSGSSFIPGGDDQNVRHVPKPSPPRPTSFSPSSSFQSSGSPYVVTSRPSLSSVSGRESSFATPSHYPPQPKAKANSNTSYPPLFSKAKIIIAAVVAIFLAFVFYQNMESSQDNNPVPKIGEK